MISELKFHIFCQVPRGRKWSLSVEHTLNRKELEGQPKACFPLGNQRQRVAFVESHAFQIHQSRGLDRPPFLDNSTLVFFDLGDKDL